MKVTIFRRIADSEKQEFTWQRTVYDNAVITSEENGIADGRESMQKTSLIVRLFGGNIAMPTVGDMIITGEVEISSPPKSACTVKSISDNRKGSGKVSHIKIIAE